MKTMTDNELYGFALTGLAMERQRIDARTSEIMAMMFKTSVVASESPAIERTKSARYRPRAGGGWQKDSVSAGRRLAKKR